MTPGYMEKGVRLRGVLVNGELDSVKVLDGGISILTIPDVVIDGDGSGAVVTVEIEGGSLVYENTTKVPDWKDVSCPDYRPDPITPESVPYCDSGDTPGCDCLDIPESSYLTNTYALKSPLQFRDYATCIKRGYKVVWCKKEWFGMFGFCESGDDDTPNAQVKYLKKVKTATFLNDQAFLGPGGNSSTTLTVTTEINRYTGIETVTRTATGYSYDEESNRIDYDDPDDPYFDGAWTKFASIITEPEECPLPDDWETVESLDACAMAHPGTSPNITESQTYSETVLTYAKSFNCPDDCGANCNSFDTASITLSVPYTPADVLFDWKSLIAQIDLGDDLKLPWRTDIPEHVPDPGYYTPQLGPSYGPLICWAADADNDNAPIVRGLMNPAGYEPFFDRTHINKGFQECSPGSGAYAWHSVSQGAFCPERFGTATQWTDDATNNMFHVGQNSSFNSSPRQYDTCTQTLVWDSGTLWGCKYAEIYLYEFPHHNDARPCGEADRATIDPDTVTCENPDGDLRWPDAPCFCNNQYQLDGCDSETHPEYVNPLNTTRKLGSYSLKKWLVESGVLTKSCTGGNMTYTPCKPVAIFFQDESLSGVYAMSPGAVVVPMEHVTFFDERTVSGFPQGDWKTHQFHQVMQDPLWKRPKSTDGEGEECVVVEDDTAIIPYEENTECANAVEIPDNPQDPWPWSYEQIEIDSL